MTEINSSPRDINSWKLISSKSGPSLPLFKVEIKRMQNPRNAATLDAIVLHARDTVNIVATDKNGALLLVKQYRFGIDQVIDELPAGIIDSGESPIEAAKRELREETGYSSKHWEYLGASYLNPAYVTNQCHHFLATKCEKTHDTHLDDLEDIALVIVPQHEIADHLRKGSICDSVGKNAIHMVFPPEA